MRPTRLVLLLTCFVALPVFLTLFSLLYSHPRHQVNTRGTTPAQTGGLRAFFSFHTPSSLFPPSAIISLTDDNSTFFLARPAAFGPYLPSDGLSGQLWVGSGFGEDSVGRGGAITEAEGELGCSDVPGWADGKKPNGGDKSGDILKGSATLRLDNQAVKSRISTGHERRSETAEGFGKAQEDRTTLVPSEDDGTDDHLHHPLPESRVVKPGKPGQLNTDGNLPAHADIQSLQESVEIAGKVVLLSRGGCGFLEKVKWVQRRGGVALIVGDDTRGGALVTMYARGDTSNVTIPALFTSYTTAHLLSSLIPPDGAKDDINLDDGSNSDPAEDRSKKPVYRKKNGKKSKATDPGPTFTPIHVLTRPTGLPRPSILPTSGVQSWTSGDSNKGLKTRSGWLQSLGSALGIGGSTSSYLPPDSRRPPSSGRIDWIVSDSWADEPVSDQKKGTTGSSSKAGPKGKTAVKSATLPSSGDDFVIGVQDWRDPDLVNHNPQMNAQEGESHQQTSTTKSILISSSLSGKQTGSADQKDGKGLAGGSTTPGSGIYDSSASQREKAPTNKNRDTSKLEDSESSSWLGRMFGSDAEDDTSTSSNEAQNVYRKNIAPHFKEDVEFRDNGDTASFSDHDGLWVTMTPTTMATSPFFDTLLVLVVSPLVTLTVVYAMLLLRSRIRRRRWRAPKSVVDRLPVRTYHTMGSSDGTSSQIASPLSSNASSPLLQSSSKSYSRSRPRSQTTSQITENVSGSLDKATSRVMVARGEKPGPPPRKRYTGKQVECVVCLEEYIDGQSRVMSLPCGHEFHAECM